jgi:hypothetical protein
MSRRLVGKQELGPVLKGLLESGKVWIEGRNYVEIDTDGVIVGVGSVGFESDCEGFLANR